MFLNHIKINPNQVFDPDESESIWTRVDPYWIFNPNKSKSFRSRIHSFWFEFKTRFRLILNRFTTLNEVQNVFCIGLERLVNRSRNGSHSLGLNSFSKISLARSGIYFSSNQQSYVSFQMWLSILFVASFKFDLNYSGICIRSKQFHFNPIRKTL